MNGTDAPARQEALPMAVRIRRVDYFNFWLDDKPGGGARLLGKLKDAGVNILSFTAFPGGGGRAQQTIVPENPETLLAAVKSAGLALAGMKPCFLAQGDDHVGAAHEVLARLAEANINLVAANGCATGGGTFAMVIFVKPGDVTAASGVLGV
jgi:hypothetical protein